MALDKNINITEGQVIFNNKVNQGHSHDGISSAKIDLSSYSIFDLVPIINETSATTRGRVQAGNENKLKTFIINTVQERVLNPTGITLKANTIDAQRIIVDGTITSNLLSSNIVLVNNVISSNNYVQNSTGWIISSNGTAEFSNVNIRGNIYLSNTGGSSYNSSTTALFANSAGYFSLKDKLTWDGTSLTIRGTLQFPDGSTPGTFDNGDGLTAGTIGGIEIGSTYIRSTDYIANPTTAGFSISSDGTAVFNEMTVRGTVYAGAGEIGGILLNSSSLYTSTFDTSTGFALYSNGKADFRNVVIGNNLNIGTTVRINEPSGDGGATMLKVKGNTTGNSNWSFRAQNSTPTNIFGIRNDGELFADQIGSASGTALVLDSSGYIKKSTSSILIKENVDYFSDQSVLEFITKLKPVKFTYKRNKDDTDFTYELKQLENIAGFIVEDIEKVQNEIGISILNYSLDNQEYRNSIGEREPFTDIEDFNHIKAVSYREPAILSISVKAIQELIAKIEELEARIQTLEGV